MCKLLRRSENIRRLTLPPVQAMRVGITSSEASPPEETVLGDILWSEDKLVRELVM